MARMGFAWWALWARFRRDSQKCPYCGHDSATKLGTKWMLIEARRCSNCDLLYRWPADDPARARRFYEGVYTDESRSGTRIRLPGRDEIDLLKQGKARATPHDHSTKIDLFARHVAAGCRVLDFGCSWGYATVQLRQRGFDAVGFELSRRRAAFGAEAFGLKILSDVSRLKPEVAGKFTAVYAHHVLEHCDQLKQILQTLASLLEPEGVLFIAVPNAGGELARQLGIKWGPMIGETHTIAFEAEWFEKNLPELGFEVQLFSDPLRDGVGDSTCRGEELFCIAVRK